MKNINFDINQLRLIICEICKNEIKDKAKDFIKENTNLTEHEVEDFAELMTKFVIDEL